MATAPTKLPSSWVPRLPGYPQPAAAAVGRPFAHLSSGASPFVLGPPGGLSLAAALQGEAWSSGRSRQSSCTAALRLTPGTRARSARTSRGRLGLGDEGSLGKGEVKSPHPHSTSRQWGFGAPIWGQGGREHGGPSLQARSQGNRNPCFQPGSTALEHHSPGPWRKGSGRGAGCRGPPQRHTQTPGPGGSVSVYPPHSDAP